MMKNIQAFAIAGMLLWGSFASAVTWLDYQGGDVNFSGWDASAFGGFGLPNDIVITQEGSTLGITATTVGDSEVRGALFTTEAFGTSIDMTSFGAAGEQVAGLSMDFTGGTTTAGLGFYFESAAGDHWFYEFLGNPGAGRYSASFASDSGWIGWDSVSWDDIAGDPFANALMDVTRVGFFIFFNPDAAQTYGLNDFGLTIPEPETYMILGMALLSVMVVFRKRITDSLAEARAMLQA